MSWTDERIALLKKMWKDGKSAAEIAKVLARGVTRNAVIGKAHRMGLSGRPSPIKKQVAAPKKEPAKKEIKAPLKKTVVPVVTGMKHNPLIREVTAPRQMAKEVFPEDGGVALIDLTERMCKWPFGDPREDDFTFCGRPIRPGTPYCHDHAAQAYQSSSRSRAVTPHEEKVVEESADDDEAEAVT